MHITDNTKVLLVIFSFSSSIREKCSRSRLYVSPFHKICIYNVPAKGTLSSSSLFYESDVRNVLHSTVKEKKKETKEEYKLRDVNSRESHSEYSLLFYVKRKTISKRKMAKENKWNRLRNDRDNVDVTQEYTYKRRANWKREREKERQEKWKINA